VCLLVLPRVENVKYSCKKPILPILPIPAAQKGQAVYVVVKKGEMGCPDCLITSPSNQGGSCAGTDKTKKKSCPHLSKGVRVGLSRRTLKSQMRSRACNGPGLTKQDELNGARGSSSCAVCSNCRRSQKSGINKKENGVKKNAMRIAGTNVMISKNDL
jgi:hypothetical protein